MLGQPLDYSKRLTLHIIIYLLCSFQRTMLIYSYMNVRVFADLSKPNNVGYCTKYSAKVST